MRTPTLLTCLVAVFFSGRLAVAASPGCSSVADVGGHFGMHGPTFSHQLHGQAPNRWAEGEALFHVLEDSGAGWARQDFWWSVAEPEQGKFQWDDFDRAINAYNRHGIKLFAILCYTSAWSNGVCPQTDEDRAQFANYVYEMVKRYRGKVGAWEIWNEPNIQPFWSPRPDPELYAKLLIAAYDAAKRADPDCVVVGGGLAGPDAEFLAGMYQHGARGHFDVFSYHNYGQQLSMETEWPSVAALRSVMAQNGDGDKPIWQTENGFFTGPVGISEAEQGAWIVRYSIGLLALGIEKTFQLTLHDWTDDPKTPDLSSYRGITHANLTRKPSFDAYRTMCRNLNGKRLVATFEPVPGICGFLFEQADGDERIAVFWRQQAGPAEPVKLDLDVPVTLVEQIDGNGERLRSNSGVYELAMGADPIYVLNPGPAIVRQKLVRWPNPVTTKLARTADAKLTVSVDNPSDQETYFLCEHGELHVVAPSSSNTLTVPLDLAHAAVGRQTIKWMLAEDTTGKKPIVRGVRTIEVRSPFDLRFGSLTHLSEDQPTLTAVVDNNSDQPARVMVRFLADGEPMGSPRPVLLAADREATVEAPFDLARVASGRAVPLSVELHGNDLQLTASTTRMLIRCPESPAGAKVDGDVSEWQGVAPQLSREMFHWAYVNAPQDPAPGDLAVSGWVGHDAEGLRVALIVEDDSISLAEGRAVWNWDSVQVGLDLASDAEPKAGYDANDLEIELARGADGKLWCYLGQCPAGWPVADLESKLVADVTVDESAGRYTYELLIPASLLVSTLDLKRDTVLGFSIMVNDNDADGRAGWLELTPGIGMGKQPENFAWLWLR
ncbi:MAG: endo-1,4-beta-xylanase [Phycisphaerales bacterium]|nr:endo-1,4-beta-xylanase [Phycisphaerales bacterium]